jgi:ribonuclease HII
MPNNKRRTILNFSICSEHVVKLSTPCGILCVPMLSIRHTDDSAIEAGIDEAGRGCFWGPLYAGAVIWLNESEMTEEQKAISAKIKDSKKLSEKRRTVLADQIKQHAKAWGLGVVSAAELHELGVTRGNQLAFSRALASLAIVPERLVIDGCLSVYDHPWAMIPQVVEPEADTKYVAVAAASILAKTGRDSYVVDICKGDPMLDQRYGLSSNKGYGTLKHRMGILRHGTVAEHRPQFLRKLLSS